MPSTNGPEPSDSPRQALYYPFHLCHGQTLQRLLESYDAVHFRDYMALQLTPLSGTTAYPDRMGDQHGTLLKEGKIVQGYPVSGPLDDEAVKAVNRDLADGPWRASFHRALRDDRRFQRGLFDLSHGVRIGETMVPGPAALLGLLEEARLQRSFTVQDIQALSAQRLSLEEGYGYEYGLALVKTSAALRYTIRLCARHGLTAVTDSETHFRLLDHICGSERLQLHNRWLPRSGY
jgi:hypothetical protein